MKKIFLFIFVFMAIVALCEAKVNLVTKSITIYPEKEIGKIARIVFNTESPGSFLFLIKDEKGKVVKSLSSGKIDAGQHYVDWDGKDFSGKTVSEGEYTVYVISGISFSLDESFGNKGRIGLESFETKVVDPEKIIFKVSGEIKKITVGETEYYKTNDFSVAGPNYIVKDGNIHLNPTGGAKKDDIVKVEYYSPFSLENPWAIDVDSTGNLYVLYKWKKESMKVPPGTLVKISPDGKKIVDDFGTDGKIGPFAFQSSQVIVDEKDSKIYIAASHDSGHGTGVFSLKTGAFLYSIGGWFVDGSNPKTTPTPGGIALGPDNKIYIRGFSAYDRTKDKDKGFLYKENPIKRHSGYPPLIDNYWGPSMESALQPECFFVSSYYSDIAKIKDTGTGFLELYSTTVNGNPIGMSFSPETGLLFVALRTIPGEIAVLVDTGISLNEMWRLKDNSLGTTHAVKLKGDYLYVLEDGISPGGRILDAMKKAKTEPAGKNRISRYKISLEQEKEVCKVSVKNK